MILHNIYHIWWVRWAREESSGNRQSERGGGTMFRSIFTEVLGGDAIWWKWWSSGISGVQFYCHRTQLSQGTCRYKLVAYLNVCTRKVRPSWRSRPAGCCWAI